MNYKKPYKGRALSALSMSEVELIKVNEIFFSIQGESSWVGHPTVFVRTSGCHLRCTYCDTTYAYYEGQLMGVEDILLQVQRYQTKYVCITGGEPLLQKDVFLLAEKLCTDEYFVSVETSGDLDCTRLDPRVKKIIDVKTPDSGAPHAFCKANLNLADVNNEFKFVICSEKDFEWAENFCVENGLFKKTNVLYSPSYSVISEKWLAKKILSSASTARLQLQLHKYIWSPTERGV